MNAVYGIVIVAVGVADNLNPIFMSCHAIRFDISMFLVSTHCVNGIAVSTGNVA